MTHRILIISDDQTSESLRRALAGRGFEVTVTENADDGYQRIIDARFDLVVINLDRAITGAAAIRRIRSNPALRGIRLLTVAEWGTGQASIALAQGADAFEPRPVETDRLIEAIEGLLQRDIAIGNNSRLGRT